MWLTGLVRIEQQNSRFLNTNAVKISDAQQESSEPVIGSNDKKQTMVMVTGAGLLEPQYRD
ncbi:hypothetical protein YC2023_035907 [Brassica napus]